MKDALSTLDGMFIRDPVTGHYEPYVPDPEVKYPGLVIAGLCLAAWCIFGGIFYAVWLLAS